MCVYRTTPLRSTITDDGHAQLPNRRQMAKSLSCTTGYRTLSSLVAATTLSYSFSCENSGEWTPTTVRPSFSYFACQSRNCGITFLQLYQPYVQNSTKTTRPRSFSIESGSLL